MKKLIAIILGLLLVCTVVLGCGGNKKQEHAKAKVKTSDVQKAGAAAVKNNGTLNSENSKASEADVKANLKTITVEKLGTYNDKLHVAKYIDVYKKLPSNYITKNEAKKLGWQVNGTLDKVAPGKSIGGDYFANKERLLPTGNNRKWTECDIDYEKGNRNGKRIVFSNDGLIYYTDDHYKTFHSIR